MNHKFEKNTGYTLLELLIVVFILSLMASIIFPRYDLVLLRAHQAKTKSNLGTLRTTISIYYSENEGHYPLEAFPKGNSHFAGADKLSFTKILSPRWIDYVPVPLLKDRWPSFNGISGRWDVIIPALMTQNPADDVYLVDLTDPSDFPDPQDYYTPLLVSPYAFDHNKGIVFIPNSNNDITGNLIYKW